MIIYMTQKELENLSNLYHNVDCLQLDPNTGEVGMEATMKLALSKLPYADKVISVAMTENNELCLEINEEFNIGLLQMYSDLAFDIFPILILCKNMFTRFSTRFKNYIIEWSN